jgi:predicted ATPase/DNA-binding XRE family transcriptional regulator/uncharacterized protein HemY
VGTGDQVSSFGELLRAYRTERRLSQDELAERAGLSVAAISALERGLTRWPYRDTVARLTNALALPPEKRIALGVAAQRPTRARPDASIPAADTDPASPRTLPVPLTGLIGRNVEVQRLQELLSDSRTRLLTLIGPGGVGKTRLATEVARALQGDYSDGVVFASVAPIQDARVLPITLARSLGIGEPPGGDVISVLVDLIGQRRLLLVLDNCEHLIDACADLAVTLLAACTRLTVLATSRMALRIRGERVFPVEPLAVPLSAGDALARAVARSPAVALFVERAQDALPDFTLDTTNAADVAAICRRLDGLPLAIELAAVQCSYLSPRALLARLRSSLPLLHGGARDLPARQQTLRSALDWSYNLLSDETRRVFRCLAVCVGGCTLELAAAVCGMESADLESILLVLESLVGASLVVGARRSDLEPRFSMLETIRDYGLERLVESGEAEQVRVRHVAWCLALAEQAAPELSGPEQDRWLDRLEAEHANMDAALYYAPPPDPVGRQLALALWRFWYTRGYLAEGRRWLEAVPADHMVSAAERASVLHAAGMLAWRQGDYDQARAWHEESLALRRELEDRQGIASSLENLGMVAWRQSDYQQARSLHEQSLAMRRELDDLPGTASSLYNLSIAMGEQGQYEQAEKMYRESLAIRRQLGDKQGVANSLNSLGLLMWEQGNYAQAVMLHQESLAIVRELGDKKGIANSLNNLGNIADARHEYDDARRQHEESLAIMRELEDRQGIANSLNNLGRIAHEQGHYEYAWRLLEEGLVRARSIGAKYHVAESLEGLASLAATLEQPERAVRLYGSAAALRTAIGAPLPLRERRTRQQAVGALREQLGAPRFADAWSAGEALSLDQAVAEVRGG